VDFLSKNIFNDFMFKQPGQQSSVKVNYTTGEMYPESIHRAYSTLVVRVIRRSLFKVISINSFISATAKKRFSKESS
jgi:hypothetical protein